MGGIDFRFQAIFSCLASSAEPALSGTCLSFPQVTIEVVQDPQAEGEMDLPSEPSSLWPLRAPSWLPSRELFWPLFWGYQEGDEGAASLEDRAPGDAEEEEGKDYAVEYGDGEDQGGTGEDEDGEPWSSGAVDNWDYGWLGPQDKDFQEPGSYGEYSGLASPALPYEVQSGNELGEGGGEPPRQGALGRPAAWPVWIPLRAQK